MIFSGCEISVWTANCFAVVLTVSVAVLSCFHLNLHSCTSYSVIDI